MFGGTVNKVAETTLASATTISPKSELVRITGTAEIVTITPINNGGFSSIIWVVPVGIFTWTAAGNIALAGTAVVGKVIAFAWSRTQKKWYPSSIA